MMRMKRLPLSIFLVMLMSPLKAAAPENSFGLLGRTSAGALRLSLEITETVQAGILTANNETSDLKTLVSSGLVQGLNEDESMKLSLCVMSSGGGSFEITSFEMPGQQQTMSQYGYGVPLQVGFGNDVQDTVLQKSVTDLCTAKTVVPVTVQLKEQPGKAVGRVNGRLNLLVKSV